MAKKGVWLRGGAHLQQQRILEDSLNGLDEVGVDGEGVAHRSLTRLQGSHVIIMQLSCDTSLLLGIVSTH